MPAGWRRHAGAVDEPALRQLLDDVRAGALTADDAVAALRRLPFADLGFARVDHHRALRQGMAEAVYGPGKTPEQCAAIVAELLAEPARRPVLLTRADDDQAAAALAATPAAQRARRRTVGVAAAPPNRPSGSSCVTAGTADLPVADECATTLDAHGFGPMRVADVGVAGVHRLLGLGRRARRRRRRRRRRRHGGRAGQRGRRHHRRRRSSPCPPASGYGAALEGVTALLAMLASCAAGLTVVGIDNGFGAACAVLRMLRMRRDC